MGTGERAAPAVRRVVHTPRFFLASRREAGGKPLPFPCPAVIPLSVEFDVIVDPVIDRNLCDGGAIDQMLDRDQHVIDIHSMIRRDLVTRLASVLPEAWHVPASLPLP
jgi:hypothetical protein